jgi:hypothetical protein
VDEESFGVCGQSAGTTDRLRQFEGPSVVMERHRPQPIVVLRSESPVGRRVTHVAGLMEVPKLAAAKRSDGFVA